MMLKFKVHFKNFLLIYLWVIWCFKVGDNGVVVSCKGLTLFGSQNPVQIKPILLKISDKVLAAITVKSFLRRVKHHKTTQLSEAFRLVLVKCQDNKMVKSPYNCVILPLTQPQVANQQKKMMNNRDTVRKKIWLTNVNLCHFYNKIVSLEIDNKCCSVAMPQHVPLSLPIHL